MAASDPKSVEEYQKKFFKNQFIDGHGVEGVRTHIPCAFCAEPDFQVLSVLGAEDEMQEETTCKHCGRSGKTVFLVNEPGRKHFEFVQTGGEDPPVWLVPTPRRVDAD
jgi:hypothetical protein